jgi:hypothetical protein
MHLIGCIPVHMCDFNLWNEGIVYAWADLEDQCSGIIWKMMTPAIYMWATLEYVYG